MSPSCSTSCLCSAKIGSQTLGAALWAGGSSWGITLLLANLAVRCLSALAHGMMQKAVGDKFDLNLFAHFTPWSLAYAFIKCYCPEMHLFCCLICQCSFSSVLFCSAVFVFLWYARVFLLLLALRLTHTTHGPVSISATSWTAAVNLPDLILHLIFCAFPPSQSRLVIGSRDRVLTWICGRVTFLEKALLGSPCPPLVISCWYKCCLCQTDEISGEARSKKKGLFPTHLRSCVF